MQNRFFEALETRQFLSGTPVGVAPLQANLASAVTVPAATAAATVGTVTAVLKAPTITRIGTASDVFTVTYSGYDKTKWRLADQLVYVTGPAAYSVQAHLVSSATTSTGTVATYSIAAPTGGWRVAVNGTYTVTLKGKATSTSPRVTSTLGTFKSAIFVNKAPTFVAGPNQTVAHDSGTHTVVGWAKSISPGATSEASQTLTFQVTTNNNALFSVLPTISRSGTLTYKLAAGKSGKATVTVRLKDSGGTANGGVNISIAHTFTITVTPPVVTNMVGSYSGTLVIPAVGHNKPATLTITSQAADGSFVGTMVSSNVSLHVTGKIAANGTFTMSMATPAGTPHAGGAIALTTHGTAVTHGKQLVLALSFTLPAPVTGTLTLTRA